MDDGTVTLPDRPARAPPPVITRLPTLTKRSLAVALAAVGLVVAEQALVQQALARLADSYQGIGALARHRTFTERMVRSALVLSRPDAPPAVAVFARHELAAAVALLDSLRRDLHAPELDERRRTLREAMGGADAALAAADVRLLAALPAVAERRDEEAVERMLAAEQALGVVLADGQRALGAVADAQLERLRQVELWLAGCLVTVLAAGVMGIVRPAARAADRLTAALLASRERLRRAHDAAAGEREFAVSLVASASDAMFAFDRALRITAWNPAMERWTGVLSADAIGRRPEEIQAELDWGEAGRPYARALAGESTELHECPGRAAPEAPVRYFDATCVPLQGSDGAILGGLVAVRDVTARREAAEQVRRSEARFHALYDQAPLGICLHDDEGCIVDANPAFERFIGRSAAELKGMRAADLSPPEDGAVTRQPVRELKAGTRSSVTVEKRFVRATGDTVWASLTICRVDALGEGLLMGMVQDVTARRELEARLSYQAYHDPLTGLANRIKLRERLETVLAGAERDPESVALVFVDLDDFKKVNDSLGHAAGDRLLRVVAERLLNATRGSDTVARLGGDEFAILLENVRADEDVRVVAERVERAMRQAIAIDGQEVFVGASVGIARATAETAAQPGAPDALLRNADVAMYVAKRGGKGRHAFYERAMNADALARLELESELRHALDRGELVLHYQPIVDLAGSHVVGAEALLRWGHPRRGLLPPGEFIPLAEETGLIVPIGRWVLDEACRQGAAWHARHAEATLTMTVNVSARQIAHGSLVDDVRDALAASGLPPAQLLLELTENVFLEHEEATLATLHALRALGVRLAIDDFGTGYASLRQLRRFPVDVLKIDKTFVDGLAVAEAGEDSGPEVALARAIVALGETFSLRTVAEGIERAPQGERLRQLGCDFGQGFLFGRALPPAELERMLDDPVAAGALAGAGE